MGQCHVPTHSTIVSPSIGFIKLNLVVPQIGGLQSIATITSLKHQDHLELKDTLVPSTCQKSQMHLPPDQKHKKLGNGKKSLGLGVAIQEKIALEDSLRFSPWEEEEKKEKICMRRKWKEVHVHLARDNLTGPNQMTKLWRAP